MPKAIEGPRALGGHRFLFMICDATKKGNNAHLIHMRFLQHRLFLVLLHLIQLGCPKVDSHRR